MLFILTVKFDMINIRTAYSNDLNRLADLWYEQMVIRSQSAGLTFNHTREEWITRASDWIVQKSVVIYVAEINETITGFVLGHVEGETGYIDDMIMDAHTYHGGQGRQLFKTIRDWLATHAIEYIIISTPRYHAVEQAFWRSLGAVEIEWKDAPCPPGMMTMTL